MREVAPPLKLRSERVNTTTRWQHHSNCSPNNLCIIKTERNNESNAGDVYASAVRGAVVSGTHSHGCGVVKRKGERKEDLANIYKMW